jgi:hypothetical protein
MPVPYTFGTATTSIPLSNLDANFNTPVTIGNTTVGLGNTVTTIGNLTLTNATISTGNVTVTTGIFGAGSNTAPSITTTGDTNTGIFFPAADTIAFTEGGAESLRINSDGNVLIGNTGISAGLPANGSLVVGARTFLSASGGDTQLGGLSGSNVTSFYANGAVGMLLNGSGGGLQVVGSISVGNATPSTSGAGITFPATQSASSNANTLDDYEEGTFTPAYEPSSGSFTTLNYAYQDGKYTKIGNVVYVQIDMATSAVTVGTASSQVKITGLPFAPSITARAMMNQCNNWSGGTPPDSGAVSTGSFIELGINNYYQNAACNVSDMSTQTATRNEVHANFFYYIS